MEQVNEVLDAELSVNENELAGKYYSKNALMAVAFFAGPIAIAYMVATNFKAMKKAEMVKSTWTYGILITIVGLALALVLPDEFPGIVFAVAYMFGAKTIYDKLLKSDLAAADPSGDQQLPWYNSLLVAVIGIAIQVVVIVVAYVIYEFVLAV